MNASLLHGTGYVFNFSGHGAFDPQGKVAEPLSQDAIDAHNRALAALELDAMRESGRGVLYSFKDTSGHSIGTWASKHNERFRVTGHSYSRNNWGAQRTDVWFNFDGSVWHGVNIGDNDIVRCKRTKQKAR